MSHPDKHRLRSGFTTGTAAAAATASALQILLTGKAPEAVGVRLLTGDRREIRIHGHRQVDRQTASATVIKDGGDDPDATHKAEIGATVHLVPWEGPSEIVITGGQGVGRVTKPGLETPVGQPAITPGPLKMIRQAAQEVLDRFHRTGRVMVEIFVPRGEALAAKTLNARLGIVGGISILGTSGVVRPLSHAAYVATIEAALSVARAAGLSRVVATTGRRSERFAQNRWPDWPAESFVQMGDYVQKTMRAAGQKGFREILLAVFFGKAIKIAQGLGHTHARTSRLALDRLADWALEETGRTDLAARIAQANTARQVFDWVKAEHPQLVRRVGREMVRAAERFSGYTASVRAVIFDFNGQPVFDSRPARTVEEGSQGHG